MGKKPYSSKILKKNNLTNSIISLQIAKPANFKFQAGQFIQFYIPDSDAKKNNLLVPYSLCSTPNDNYLKFCIKLTPNGIPSIYLKKIQVGDKLTFAGPYGKFIIKKNNTPLHFIATGVGISPILGILKDELENKKNTQPLHLLFGLRFEKDIFWIKHLDKLKQNYPNFDYQLTLSKPSKNWRGLKERVTKHLPKKALNETHYYICGSRQMVTDVRKLLAKQGVNKKNIYFEIF